MPVNVKISELGKDLSQREIYSRGGISKLYWDYRDKKIIESIPNNAKTILDAGCGEGITLEKIIDKFPESVVSGVDYLDENVNICKQNSLDVKQGDLLNLDFSDDTFDCIILSEVLEHIEKDEELIASLKRVLKPAGIIVIVVPNDLTFYIYRLLTFKFKEATFDPGHIKKWNKKKLAQLLKKFELNITNSFIVPFKFWSISLHCIMSARK